MMTSAEVDANRQVRRAGRTVNRLVAVTVLVTIAAVFGLLSPASAATLGRIPDGGTAQTDGTVYSILLRNNRVYLGGSFDRVKSGGSWQPRAGLAAINARTGKLTDWNPRVDKQVLALATARNSSNIYIGGSFTRVNGTSRENLVAVTAGSGEIDTAWKAEANRPVYSLETWNDRVFFGGQFTSVRGVGRKGLAAVDADTGRLDSRWTPSVNGNVRTLALSPDKSRIYAGGNFSQLSGERRPNLGALDPVTGAVKGWTPNPGVNNDYEVFDLAVTSSRVHVAGGGQDPDGTAESFSATTGRSAWRYSSSGDFQAVALLRGKLYFGGHFTRLFKGQGEIRRNKFMAVDPATGALNAQWTPQADKGVWAMTEDPQRNRVYAGGAFAKVNDLARSGFAQFSRR